MSLNITGCDGALCRATPVGHEDRGLIKPRVFLLACKNSK